MEMLDQAKKVLEIESKAVANLIPRLDINFEKAVELLNNSKGRLIVTGMGKSGIIGKKIAATFTSIGTPAFFLHPAEGIHGDLGIIVPGDIVIAISNSGETPEIVLLLNIIKRFEIKLIALTGKMDSTLAKQSDIVLDVSVDQEACPLGLVPSASTTATLAMGDALAIVLLTKKGLRPEDFAVYHPGGSLGKQLLLRISELMHAGNFVPKVKEEASLKEVIMEISSKRLGMTTVVDLSGMLKGIVTDGDLRRLMEASDKSLPKGEKNIFDFRAKEIMNQKPKTIAKDALAAEGLKVMEQYSITSLVILDVEKRPQGVIHLHDILKAGIV